MAGRAAAYCAVRQVDLTLTLIAALAAPRRSGMAWPGDVPLVPPRAAVGESAGLLRFGIGGDSEHRTPRPLPAALSDIGLSQRTSDRAGRPFRPDLTDLGDQGVEPGCEVLIFIPLPRVNVSHGSGPQRPGGKGGGFT